VVARLADRTVLDRGLNGPLGSPRAQVNEAQRARVLAAALLVLGEHGYGGMSVARVTACAGVSRRTFYDLFEDREDCFLAVFEDALARVELVAGRAFRDARGGWRERVRAGLGALLGLFDVEPALGLLLIVEALGGGPRVLERRARVLATLAAVIDHGAGGEDGKRGEDGTPAFGVTRPSAGQGGRPRRQGRQRAFERSPTLTAEGVVGGVLAVLHARLLDHGPGDGSQRTPPPLMGLLNPLMSMIVLPYLGASAARRELARPVMVLPSRGRASPATATGLSPSSAQVPHSPLNGLPMRLTYRTLRVLAAIAAHPGISNRQVADHAEVLDQGQMSKLLARLLRLGLIVNTAAAQNDKPTGAANAWTLTPRGHEVQAAIGAGSGALGR
jgi:AcrR family transcriptional regulator/DNA-binding MarR family transcriptional regulator